MKKLMAIVLSLILVLIITACDTEEEMGGWEKEYTEYVHPDFVTNYTEEEHIERLSLIASKTLGLKKFKISIVYAFYDFDPEYFLIEFEREEYKYDVYISQMTSYNNRHTDIENLRNVTIKETATNGYILGSIEDDKYYYNLFVNLGWYGGEPGFGYIQKYSDGLSPYKAYGYEDNVKYYGGQIAAVACEEGLKIVACEDCFKMRVGFELIENGKYSHKECRVGHLLTMEECEKLMLDNRKYRHKELEMPKEYT